MPTGSPERTVIGPYRIVGFLGAGGMGMVWKAHHRALGRDVAIKRLNDAARSGVPLERFRSEARLHGALNHPRIAQLYDLLDDGGVPCIVMEYIAGPTLEDVVRAGPLPADRAVSILDALTEAVAYVHQRGILHRDIKASNVKLRADGTPVLLDFGIARADGDPRLTRTGMIIGSPQAIPPEQFDGLAMDARGDVWALGVLLYELLTGRPPFRGDSLAALATAVSFGTPPAPSAVVPAVPAALDVIVARCLERDREQRYPSASALLEALRRVQSATRGAHSARLPWLVRGPRWIGAAIAAVALLITAAAWQRRTADGPAGNPGAPATADSAGPVAPPPRPPGAVMTRINVVDGAAEVLLDGRHAGSTPYEHFAVPGTTVTMTLRRAGFRDEVVTFIVSDNQREYTLVLQRDASVPSSPALFGFVAWWRRRRPAHATPARQAAAVTGERVIMEPLTFHSASQTDVGCVRDGNEDAVRIVHLGDGTVVATLCDGMGGHAAGEVASELAVTTISDKAGSLDSTKAIVAAIDAANQQIRSAMTLDPELHGMGTTCVVLRLGGHEALCAHVGDSRAYLVRDGAIYRLTEDHSHVRALVRDGEIADQDARHHPDKNVILRALGPADHVTATAWPSPLSLRPGDRFLLSSDGLHDLADDDELLPALAAADPQQACDALIALARARGAPDNVSVCIVDVARATHDLVTTRTSGIAT